MSRPTTSMPSGEGDTAYGFISIAGPAQVKPTDQPTRAFIRKHVMRKAARAKKRRPKNPQFQLSFDTPTQPGSASAASFDIAQDAFDGGSIARLSGVEYRTPVSGEVDVYKHWTDQLAWSNAIAASRIHTGPSAFMLYDPGAGRKNPFAVYPVTMSMRMHELVESEYYTAQNSHCIFYNFWLATAMHDPAVFHQLLSSAALALSSTEPGNLQHKLDAAAHQALAIGSAKGKIDDLRVENSVEALRSIISLAGHAAVRGEFHWWKIHMSAAFRVLELLGGREAVVMPFELRLITIFVDGLGSLVLDEVPLFTPLDARFHSFDEIVVTESADKPGELVSSPFSAVLSSTDQLLKILREVQSLLAYIDLKSQSRNIDWWDDPMFLLCNVYPLTDRLLRQKSTSTRLPSVAGASNAEGFRDIMRLAAILSLPRARKLSAAHLTLKDVYVERILSQMPPWSDSSSPTRPKCLVRLWVLVICILETTHGSAEWLALLQQIDDCRNRLQIVSWDALRDFLKHLVWTDSVHGSRTWQMWLALQHM